MHFLLNCFLFHLFLSITLNAADFPQEKTPAPDQFLYFTKKTASDTNAYVNFQQTPIKSHTFSTREQSALYYPDHKGYNSQESVGSAEWLRINIDSEELHISSSSKIRRFIGSALIDEIVYPKHIFIPVIDAIKIAMTYFSENETLDTDDPFIFAKHFKKRFPNIKYIDFYTTTGFGVTRYIPNATASFFNELQNECNLSIYFTDKV